MTTITETSSQEFNITVSLDGYPILNNQASFTITASDPYLPFTSCFGPGFIGSSAVGPAGIQLQFSIGFYDRYNNSCFETPLTPVVRVTDSDRNVIANATVNYDQSSQYFVARYYLPQNFGNYLANVFYNGTLVSQGIVFLTNASSIWVSPDSHSACSWDNQNTPCSIFQVASFLQQNNFTDFFYLWLYGPQYSISQSIQIPNSAFIAPAPGEQVPIRFSASLNLTSPIFIVISTTVFESISFNSCSNGAILVQNEAAINLKSVSFANITASTYLIVSSGDLSMENCVVASNNAVTSLSTSLPLISVDRDLMCNNTEFLQNNALLIEVHGDFILENSNFTSNTKRRLINAYGNVSLRSSIFNENNGGVLYHTGENLNITGCTFSRNYLSTENPFGTVVYMNQTSATSQYAFISYSRFFNNTAISTSGIAVGGAIAANNTMFMQIEECEFFANQVVGNSVIQRNPSQGVGGAVAHLGAGSLVINRSNFSENAAVGGNGEFKNTSQVIRNTYSLSAPAGAAGGAIFANDLQLSISECTFSHNRIAAGNLRGYSDLNLGQIKFHYQYVASGAAIYSIGEYDDSLTTISDSSFSSNLVVERDLLQIYGGVVKCGNLLTMNTCNFDSNNVTGSTIFGGLINSERNTSLTNVNIQDTWVVGKESIRGGILHSSAALTSITGTSISNIEVTGNQIDGIIASTTNGDASIDSSQFNSIHATGSAVNGVIHCDSNLFFTNSNITNNLLESDSSYGGGISVNSENGGVFVNNSIISYNNIQSNNSYGGGIWASIECDSCVLVTNTMLSHNRASYGGGSALYFGIFSNVIISNNTASKAGGGIYFISIDKELPVDSCEGKAESDILFVNNTAPVGSTCASVISSLYAPMKISVVYPYEKFTYAIALRDQFDNTLMQEGTSITANINQDSSFVTTVPQATQKSSLEGVFLFPLNYFSARSTFAPTLHTIEFASQSPDGKSYSTNATFTVSTCPPNTIASADTCFACTTGFSLLPNATIQTCNKCPTQSNCVTMIDQSKMLHTLNSQSLEIESILATAPENLSTMLYVAKGNWPVPTNNGFINPTALISCENCLPFYCLNFFSMEEGWKIDCSYTVCQLDFETSAEGSGGEKGEETGQGEEAEKCEVNPNDCRCCEGYKDRLCSKCDENYYKSGEEQCTSCSSEWYSSPLMLIINIVLCLFLIGIALRFRSSLIGLCVEIGISFTLFLFGLESFWSFFAVALVFLSLFVLNTHIKHGILKCFIFYVQTCSLALNSLFHWDKAFIHGFSFSILSRNGLECYFENSVIITFWIILSVPLITTALVFITYLLGKVYFNYKLKNKDYKLLSGSVDDSASDNLIPASLDDIELSSQYGAENENPIEESHGDYHKSHSHKKRTLAEKKELWGSYCIKILIFLLYVMYNFITATVRFFFLFFAKLKIIFFFV